MIDIPGLLLFSFILMRMSGFIVFNPVLGRRNVPALVRGGIIMILTLNLFTYSANMDVAVEVTSSLQYMVLLLKELFIGFILGFIMNLFFYIASFAGTFIDFNMGMSMANVFDPQSNSQVPLTGSIFNTMMTMLFFAVDGHLALIKIFDNAADVVPYAQVSFTPHAFASIIAIFQECTLLAVKLSFPFFALEFLAEVGVGILMKMVSQINFLVVNIQIKIIVGNILMLLLCIPVGVFFDNVIIQMVETMQQIIRML